MQNFCYRKVNGLLFGISECCNEVKAKQCAAVILDSNVNPRIIVQPLIEACVDARVPVLCVSDLRAISKNNFGIPTSCLGLKCDCLLELQGQILEIAKKYQLPAKTLISVIESMEVFEDTEDDKDDLKPILQCPYLYRTDVKNRIFVPSESKSDVPSLTKTFKGQDFVGFSNKSLQIDKKSYKQMILKKISNNPNRVKVKQ
jgi:ribosomal protein L7Ae-like RNA K-turn-binding protein